MFALVDHTAHCNAGPTERIRSATTALDAAICEVERNEFFQQKHTIILAIEHVKFNIVTVQFLHRHQGHNCPH